jgi:hypothetical protein
MENQVLEIEGGSLEEVRAEAKAKTPPGLTGSWRNTLSRSEKGGLRWVHSKAPSSAITRTIL